MTLTVEFLNVSAESKQGSILKNISFKIEKGEYVVLLGPTGAGPSLILQVLSGKLTPTEGSLIVNSQDVTHTLPEDRSIGYVFEQFNLFPHMSVIENVLFGPMMRAEDLEEKADVANEIISLVRLNEREDAISKELSGGMQQRVGLARAITAGAEILLLDQPYRALDAKIRAELRVEVKNIIKNLGVTCFHATHETEEAMLVADKIAVFNEGNLEFFGTPSEVFNQRESMFVTEFLAECNKFIITNTKIDRTNRRVEIADDLELTFSHLPEEEVKVVLLRQHSIKILEKDEIKPEYNVFQGKIIKIRLLGQFIRFTVVINGIEIIIRELLSIRWQNLSGYLNQEVYVYIPPDEIRLF